jgi:murein L,D-transpeptidase YcbB/YkuD
MICKAPPRLVPLMLVAAAVLAGPALAQSGAPAPKAKPAAAKPAAPGKLLIAGAPTPAFDEGSGQRIAAAMMSYSALDVRGGWPALPANAKLAPGASGPDVALLRRRLVITDDLAADKAEGDLYDDAVTDAVRTFQARHGLEGTGSVGPKTLAALNVPAKTRLRQLTASFDRLTAMDFRFGQRYVVVNLPATLAEAVDGDKVVRRHVVQVGRADRPSPTLTTHITSINLNPTWTVPLSILKKDIIPKMRKDPGYAARMHMRVFDSAGNEVDPQSIDWNSDQAPNFTVRQDSGPWNALGALRIDMPNAHSVYMHDTNHKEYFGADYRFQSSGCTRVEDPRELAAWLLAETAGWSRREMDAAIAKGERQDVRLTHKVPVAWVYLTGWVTRDGAIHFRDDVYGYDEKHDRNENYDRQAPAPELLAALKSRIAAAGANASGFLQVPEPPPPPEFKQASYLDSQ